MAITEAAYAEAQMEIERLRTALENLRRECDRAWREVDFIAKERTEHLEWRTKLANDLDECERHRDALGLALNKANAIAHQQADCARRQAPSRAREQEGGEMIVVPMTLAAANDFVQAKHRHHKRVTGHKFSIGLVREGVLIGVVIVSRPTARMSDDGTTCEVTRLCTDGSHNACSKLYRAAWRCAKEMGYRRMLTYTLPEEDGASLRGAGFRLRGRAGGGSWSRASRPRDDKHPLQEKLKWELTA